ncbi:unnamed protein product [Sympodiomycopsis kandeliae]
MPATISRVPPSLPSSDILSSIHETCAVVTSRSGIQVDEERLAALLSEAKDSKHATAQDYSFAFPLRWDSTASEVNFVALLCVLSNLSSYQSLISQLPASSRTTPSSIPRQLLLGLYLSAPPENASTSAGATLSSSHLSSIGDGQVAELLQLKIHEEKKVEHIPVATLNERGGPGSEIVTKIRETLNRIGDTCIENRYVDLGTFVVETLQQCKGVASRESEEAAVGHFISRVTAFLSQDMSDSHYSVESNAGQELSVHICKPALYLLLALYLKFASQRQQLPWIPSSDAVFPLVADEVMPALLVREGIVKTPFQITESLDSQQTTSLRAATIHIGSHITSHESSVSPLQFDAFLRRRFRKESKSGDDTEAAPPFHPVTPSEDIPDETLSTTVAENSSRPSIPPQPRLPVEILLQVLLSTELSPILSPTPITFQTLRHLLQTNRLAHHCAQKQLHEVLILPRRVREFRRYYDKEREKGWLGIGLTRGMFCALDDASRLTHTSAGWESAFLRMLHMLGPGITHLSLWHSESRALMRDAGQVQGHHRQLGAPGPAWSWSEGNSSTEETEEEDQEARQYEMTASDEAAMKERARQKMPTWLQREINNSTSPSEVAKRHRAHLLPFTDPDNPSSNDALQNHLVSQLNLLKRDKRKLKGCRPKSLSIMLSLPLFENQESELFASMIIFSKVQELDVFIPVPNHSSKILDLLSHLHRSPLKKLKISTTHFTLCLGVPPFSWQEEQQQQRKAKQRQDRDNQHAPIHLATVLQSLLKSSDTLYHTILNEFTGKNVDPSGVQHLENLLYSTALQHFNSQHPHSYSSSFDPPPSTKSHNGYKKDRFSLLQHDPLPALSDLDLGSYATTHESFPLRVRVFQKNQGGYGKLKDRKDDYIQRVMGFSRGVWSHCGMWDE